MYKTTRMMLLRRQKEEPDARVFKWEKYQFIAKTACPLRLYQALLPISKLPQRRLQQQKVATTTMHVKPLKALLKANRFLRFD